jgi:hypothetical protein
MAIEMFVPEGAQEIRYWDLEKKNVLSGRSSVLHRIKTYIFIAPIVWIVLIFGYVYLVVCTFLNFEPASAGAVLVACGIIAEANLNAYGWQRIPESTSYRHLAFWWHSETQKLYITTGVHKHIIFRTNQNLHTTGARWWNTMLQNTHYINILTLSRDSDVRTYIVTDLEAEMRWSLGWDISSTVSRTNSWIKNHIVLAVLIGTFTWAYFDRIYEWYWGLGWIK